jgi:hypothetical protein
MTTRSSLSRFKPLSIEVAALVSRTTRCSDSHAPGPTPRRPCRKRPSRWTCPRWPPHFGRWRCPCRERTRLGSRGRIALSRSGPAPPGLRRRRFPGTRRTAGPPWAAAQPGPQPWRCIPEWCGACRCCPWPPPGDVARPVWVLPEKDIKIGNAKSLRPSRSRSSRAFDVGQR